MADPATPAAGAEDAARPEDTVTVVRFPQISERPKEISERLRPGPSQN